MADGFTGQKTQPTVSKYGWTQLGEYYSRARIYFYCIFNFFYTASAEAITVKRVFEIILNASMYVVEILIVLRQIARTLLSLLN